MVTVLTTYIILFSVDFCSLIDRRRVEQTQVRTGLTLREELIKMFFRNVF